MNKKIVLLALVLVCMAFPLSASANDWWLTVWVELESDSYDTQNVQIGLFDSNNQLIQYTRSNNIGTAGFDLPNFRLADIPNLHVTFMSGPSYGISIPLSDFTHEGQGVIYIVWQLTSQATPPSQEPELPTEPTEETTPADPPTQSDVRVLRFAIGEDAYTDDGVQHRMEAASFVSAEGRTMVPLRVISEALGAIDLTHNDGVISFYIDSQFFVMVIGESLSDTMGAPVIVSGRTFVPIAFVVEEMGATARWDSTTRAAYIYIQ